MRGFELRLAWASKQTYTLKREVTRWKDAGGYGIVLEPQPNSPKQTIRLKADRPPDHFSLIISDVLHTLRAALNTLAFELAVEWHAPTHIPDDIAKGVEFPIFGTGAMTSRDEIRKIGGISPQAQTVIKGLQPHLKGQGYVDDPLWHLNELARVDRHRLPHVTIATLGAVALGGDNLHVEILQLSDTGLAEDGTVLGECILRPTDSRRPMEVKMTPEPELRFKEEPLRGKTVIGTLETIKTHILTHVVPALSPFLS